MGWLFGSHFFSFLSIKELAFVSCSASLFFLLWSWQTRYGLFNLTLEVVLLGLKAFISFDISLNFYNSSFLFLTYFFYLINLDCINDFSCQQLTFLSIDYSFSMIAIFSSNILTSSFGLYIFWGGLFLYFVRETDLHFLFDLAAKFTSGKRLLFTFGPTDSSFSIIFMFYWKRS